MVKVDLDILTQAFEAAMPDKAAKYSFLQYLEEEIYQADEKALQGFINLLQGKVAEILAKDLLESEDYSQVILAADQNQPDWDISAINISGQTIPIQVKAVTADQANEVIKQMTEHPKIHFILTDEVAEKIAADNPYFKDRIIKTLGPVQEIKEAITNCLKEIQCSLNGDIQTTHANDLPDPIQETDSCPDLRTETDPQTLVDQLEQVTNPPTSHTQFPNPTKVATNSTPAPNQRTKFETKVTPKRRTPGNTNRKRQPGGKPR